MTDGREPTMARNLTLVLSLIAALLPGVAGGRQAASLSCTPAAPVTRAPAELWADYGPAVFFVACGSLLGDRGTAFFIDNEKGYAITAYHVISKCVEDPGLSLTGRLLAFPDVDLGLTVVDTYKGPKTAPVGFEWPDIAILQVASATRIPQRDAPGGATAGQLVDFHNYLASIKPLDLDYYRPSTGDDKLCAMGFPGGVPEARRHDPAAADEDSSQTFLHIRQSVNQGYSGGPLLHADGGVFAICIAMQDDTHAWYLPLDEVAAFIERNAPVSERVGKFDAALLDTRDGDNVLLARALALRKLDLISWARLFGAHPDRYRHRDGLIRCLATHVFSYRYLFSVSDSVYENMRRIR